MANVDTTESNRHDRMHRCTDSDALRRLLHDSEQRGLQYVLRRSDKLAVHQMRQFINAGRRHVWTDRVVVQWERPIKCRGLHCAYRWRSERDWLRRAISGL